MPNLQVLPVGSAVRAASAARAASPRPGSCPRPGSAERRLPTPGSVGSRPSSADSARRTSEAMAAAPRLLMSPSHPRKGSRGDGSVGPLGREDQELRDVCRQIGELAPQKFTTVREAFRFLRPDPNGLVSRSDVLYFFRAYGVAAPQAERIIARFQPQGDGSIDCHQFVAFMRPHVAPDGEGMEQMAGLSTEAPEAPPQLPGGAGTASSAGSAGAAATAAAAGIAEQAAQLRSEFWPILEELREKAPQRFSHVREALRIVDVDYDGCITRDEMRAFFRAFGVAERESDRVYARLAKDGPGGANYHCFVQTVAPYLDLPGAASAAQPQLSGRGSRPSSAGSRPRSAAMPPVLSGALSAPASPRPPVSARAGYTAPLETPASACPSPRAPATPRSGRRQPLQKAEPASASACPSPRAPSLPRSGRPQTLESPEPARRSHRRSSAREDSDGPKEHREHPGSPSPARRSPCPPLSTRRGRPQRLESPVSAQASRVSQPDQPPSARRSPRLATSAGVDPKDNELKGAPLDPCPQHNGSQPTMQAEQEVLEQAFMPSPPPPPEKKGGRRPLGIQRKTLEEDGGRDIRQSACFANGRPVATPARRPRSRGRMQCPAA